MCSKQNHKKHNQETPRRKRAAIYLRGWDHDERHFSNGSPSITTQRRICHLMAKDLGADVVDEFADVMDASPPSHGMLRLLDRLDQEPRFDHLIVYSLDQLASNREETFIIGWRLGLADTVLTSWTHVNELCIPTEEC